MTVCEYRPGLEGIPATQSSISYVDGKEGVLEYRGIRIEDLAQHSTFSRNRLSADLGRLAV
jgi:citrate synthase